MNEAADGELDVALGEGLTIGCRHEVAIIRAPGFSAPRLTPPRLTLLEGRLSPTGDPDDGLSTYSCRCTPRNEGLPGLQEADACSKEVSPLR